MRFGMKFWLATFVVCFAGISIGWSIGWGVSIAMSNLPSPYDGFALIAFVSAMVASAWTAAAGVL